ncbi:hypothetical protein B0H17DRAFT_1129463 [Mycena rosella]|uniref:Uncharacterized protein n=1 Tax=Mycena rosella TaxID=1033263 RepID=A0AAD7DTP2_MYCRO|nr:hypothetical protein B0H17DRAFT_1129463 [Mycena rosella]
MAQKPSAHSVRGRSSSIASDADLVLVPAVCSPHAEAQARYHARLLISNPLAEHEKAKMCMRRIREARKTGTANEYMQAVDVHTKRTQKSRQNDIALNAAHSEGASLELEQNELGETYAEFMLRSCSEFRVTHDFREFREYCNKVKKFRDYVPEWREELVDFRDFISEHTTEELDKLQREACKKSNTRLMILARGGF